MSTPPNIDLKEEIILHINSSSKKHSISWDLLKAIGDKLQGLIVNIAKYEISSETPIDIDDFKLDFVGFYDGSPAPAFSYHNYNQAAIYNIEDVRSEVTNKFNELMSIADSGEYLKLKSEIIKPDAKEKIVTSLFEFTQSFKGNKVSIAKRLGTGKLNDVYNVKKFTPAQKDSIITKTKKSKISEKTTAIAKVSITKTVGKATRKIEEIYNYSGTSVTFSTHTIRTSDRVYILHNDLFFKMTREEGVILLENDQLKLYANGETEKEAEANLYQEFDWLYRRLASLNDDQLGPKIARAKAQINLLIKEIKDR